MIILVQLLQQQLHPRLTLTCGQVEPRTNSSASAILQSLQGTGFKPADPSRECMPDCHTQYRAQRLKLPLALASKLSAACLTPSAGM